ncbi:hypothetical protein FNH08_29965 [Streptomyces spongiae]|uniref:Uncharacterized protein n=1 Tax=Streptomyces spongiae TaxID=565072 RepID=A0A5N8XPC3_9ACTN|nr:hypothetical protein [Streptomyces spongiae]
MPRRGAVPTPGSPRQEAETPPAAASVPPPALFSMLSAEDLAADQPSIETLRRVREALRTLPESD